MRDEHVDFLRGYLESFPELRDRLRLAPPRVLRRGTWRRLIHVRKLATGLQVWDRGGERVSLFPAARVASVRLTQQGDLLALMEKALGSQTVQVWDKTDRNQHQTGAFLRARFGGSEPLSAIAVYDEESPDLLGRLLSASVLWWQQLGSGAQPQQLALFLPDTWGDRILALMPHFSIRFVCFKYCLSGKAVRQIYPGRTGCSRLQSPYVIYPVEQEVPSLFSLLRRQYSSLDLIFRRGSWEVSYRGFPVAWLNSEGEAFYDFCCPKPVQAIPLLESHIREVIRLRNFPPPVPDHPVFRFGEERWLESLILRDHLRVNPSFSEEIYSQVPTWVGPDRKILDLLTVTREGTLAVLELKTSQDLNILVQGLDYWDRVKQHLLREDFKPAGYFPRTVLELEPPLLYLICPLFEFHHELVTMRQYLSKEIKIVCLGINSDWKRELGILRRFEL